MAPTWNRPKLLAGQRAWNNLLTSSSHATHVHLNAHKYTWMQPFSHSLQLSHAHTHTHLHMLLALYIHILTHTFVYTEVCQCCLFIQLARFQVINLMTRWRQLWTQLRQWITLKITLKENSFFNSLSLIFIVLVITPIGYDNILIINLFAVIWGRGDTAKILQESSQASWEMIINKYCWVEAMSKSRP